MDAETMLEGIRGDLQQAQAEQEQADAKLRAASGRVDELRAAERVVRAAMERYGRKPDVVLNETTVFEVKSSDQPRWKRLPIMDAARQALVDLGRPATGYEVHDYLVKAGREENYQQVRSALAYAGRKGKIRRVGRGLWETKQSATDPRDSSAPAVTGAEDGVATSGLGGDADGSPAHDHRDDPQRRNGDRDHRTSVVEVR